MLKASKDHKSQRSKKKAKRQKTKANRFRLPERVLEHGPEMHLEQTCELLVRTWGLNGVESVEWRPNPLEKYHVLFTNPPPSS